MPGARGAGPGLTGLHFASVTVHLLAAMLWLGGAFFLASVGAPVLRRVEPPDLRADLFQRLGARFRAVGWFAIALLLATGVLNLKLRGLLDADILFDAAFWGRPYGRMLGWKLVLVAAMVSLSAVHDFVVGPRASRLAPGSPEALAARRRAAGLARINAVLGVVLVGVAVRLARGG
jgi:putative copper resistance protein D